MKTIDRVGDWGGSRKKHKVDYTLRRKERTRRALERAGRLRKPSNTNLRFGKREGRVGEGVGEKTIRGWHGSGRKKFLQTWKKL